MMLTKIATERLATRHWLSSRHSIVQTLALVVSSVLALTTPIATPMSAQTLHEQIGYDRLQAELGALLPTGASVNAALIEVGNNYLPNTSNPALAGKTISNVSNVSNGFSGHSTSSAARLFGTIGTSAGTDNVDVYQATEWFNERMRILSNSAPVAQGYDVTSHSYILNSGASSGDPDEAAMDTATQAATNDLLTRFDFTNARDNTLAFVGTSNGFSNSVPSGMAPAYNAIAVGRTDGNHGAGLTSGYGAGRIKVDLVVPQSVTSSATPVAASAGSLLIDSAGTGTEAARNQVLRATLLAGATKEEFTDWDQTTTRPLDDRYGAGELNIYNSYQIQQAGQRDGSTSIGGTLVSPNGWDYVENFNPLSPRYYTFTVGEGKRWDRVSIALAWNIDIVTTSNSAFTPVSTLADLNLRLLDDENNVLRSSLSEVDNVEHLYLADLSAGVYHLEVSGDSGTDYGLAWGGTSVTLPIATIPEPSSVVLVALAFGSVSLKRRRSHQRV